MADAARWITAAEGVLPWPAGWFLEVLSENQDDAEEALLDEDPVAAAVIKLLGVEDFCGTPTKLFDALQSDLVAAGEVRRSKSWPKAVNALSGRLKRLTSVTASRVSGNTETAASAGDSPTSPSTTSAAWPIWKSCPTSAAPRSLASCIVRWPGTAATASQSAAS